MVKPGQRLVFPWVRYKTVQKSKQKHRKLKVEAKKSGLGADKILAEHAKKEVDSSLSRAKEHYENKLVDQTNENPKRFWNYIKHFSRSSSSVDVLEHNGSLVYDDTGKAEVLNSFFVSVNTDEPPLESSQYLPTDNEPKPVLRDIKFSVDDVRKKLIKLKANKASGPDELNVNVLKHVPNFDLPLKIIFQSSLDSGTVPQDWRDANVTPLFKKGSRTKANNYRPVSLTSQVVKLFERIVYDRIYSFLKDNNFFSCDQHGFQGQCSCVTQLIECLFDWTLNYDLGAQTDVIYLDFAKAFDTVPHQRLLLKLRNAGIRGKALNWIAAFLTNRRQRVMLRNGTSGWRRVKSGVPQGSILGPLLFLVYVNDIPDEIECMAKMFADDTKAYNKITSREDCHKLQQDLNSLSAWSRRWLLSFNETKCFLLRIKGSIEYMYTLNGHYVQQDKSQKDLGVLVADDLKFSKHIKGSISRANQRIGMIKRCFSGLTKQKVETLYKAIVRPILEYASPVWNPQYQKDIDSLEKVQRRCLRLSRSEPIPMQSLEARRHFTDMCEVHKFVHNKYKTDPNYLFTFAQLQMRGHSLKLEKQYCRTNIRKHFFTNRVVDAWNSLDDDIVTAPTPKIFKTRLRAALQSGSR